MKNRKSSEYLSAVVLAAIVVSMATAVLFLSPVDLVPVGVSLTRPKSSTFA